MSKDKPKPVVDKSSETWAGRHTEAIKAEYVEPEAITDYSINSAGAVSVPVSRITGGVPGLEDPYGQIRPGVVERSISNSEENVLVDMTPLTENIERNKKNDHLPTIDKNRKEKEYNTFERIWRKFCAVIGLPRDPVYIPNSTELPYELTEEEMENLLSDDPDYSKV